jgi:hypothetical protein
MRVRVSFLVTVFALLISFASAQVTLQPWTEVFGTVNGQQLGKYVNRISPSANLPYKAAASKVGSTGIYRLNSPTDTSTQRVFFGENLLTGDLNNDGHTDVVVTKSLNGWDTVSVYWGTATGIDTLNPLKIPGDAQGVNFGASCIADVNNDGHPDLICCEPNYGLDQGKVSVHLGPNITSTPSAFIIGDSIRSGLGGVARVGDLNNDGFNDLIIRGWNQAGPSASRYDYINIYWGTGIDTLNLSLGMQLRGASLVSTGLACFDANGDGIEDLLWTNQDSLDWIYVHLGGSSFSFTPNLRLRDPQFAEFGTAITNAGDMNGDGHEDVVVGAYFSNNPGFIYVYGGGPRIDQYFDAAVGMTALSYFGYSVSSVGDVTGDGLADIIIGAPNYEFGDQRGCWGIFKGDSTIRVTSVSEAHELPKAITLHQCYPNPFNPTTKIEYELQQRASVTLKVYNLLGEELRTLVNATQDAGQYAVQFDARGLAAGTYFYEIIVRTEDGTITRETKKMLLLSERERREQDEYRQHLLTRGRAGDEAARRELARLEDEHVGGRLKRFLMPLDQKPDTILYLKDATVYFYDKDISRLKAIGVLP